MSAETNGQAEAPTLPRVDLVHIDVTTTRAHAAEVLSEAVKALDALAVTFADRQRTQMVCGLAGHATYTNHQLGLILKAQADAQQLHETFTTQGETKNED